MLYKAWKGLSLFSISWRVATRIWVYNYVRMKKESLEGPDAQGPRSNDAQPDFPVPSSEAETGSPE